MGQKAATTALTPFFMHLVSLLLHCGARPDADEKNLRASAYNALSTLISKSGEDCRSQMEVRAAGKCLVAITEHPRIPDTACLPRPMMERY